MKTEDAIEHLLRSRIITPTQAVQFLRRAGYDAGNEAEEMIIEWLSDRLSLSDLDEIRARFP